MKDEPHIYGDDCLACFPAGKTPKYVWVRFILLASCVPDLDPPCAAPPNDRVFKLTQDDSVPCFWRYLSDDWIIWYYTTFGSPPKTRLDLWDTLGRVHFLALEDACAPEGTVFNNTVLCSMFGACTHEGIATVTWTQEATNLMAAINMQRGDDVFMELHPLVDGNKIYKFCRLRDATNIAIELEPD